MEFLVMYLDENNLLCKKNYKFDKMEAKMLKRIPSDKLCDTVKSILSMYYPESPILEVRFVR